MNLHEIFEKYVPFGVAHYCFYTTEGKYHEGHIIEISDNYFTFVDGGPLSDNKERCIEFTEVDMSRLSYWSENKKRCVEVRWEDSRFIMNE